jgi:hypothetical protein
MAYIFGTNSIKSGELTGIMNVVATGTAVPLTFTMSPAIASTPGHVVLSGVSARTQGNYQLLLTLRNYTYVYVFGEKMGDVVVSGIGGMECFLAGHGLTAAMDYYNAQAISITGTPIDLQFAGYIVKAFLVGGKFDYMNPKSRLAKFQLIFKTIVPP